MERIVLAYSGHFNTSVAVPWLAETYRAEVIAVTLDLGQGRDVDSIRDRALAAGAARAHVLDVRAEFAERHVLPALQAGAVCAGRGPLATALSRPLMASKLVEIARLEGAGAVAHGCAGNASDQVRIDVSVRAIEPGLTIIAPARIWEMTPQDEIAFARRHGIPVPPTQASSYRTDTNLWGRSIEGGRLDDPAAEPPPEIFTMTADPARCPDEPAYVEIEFERGVPAAVNGIAMSLADIIGSLGTIAGNHGVGRIDTVEHRLVGVKARAVYEAPAAVVLHQAHAGLETFVMPADLDRLTCDLGRTYADLADNGLWYSPMREAIDAFVAKTQEHVTGTVRVKLFKGASSVVGRRSPHALCRRAPAASSDGERVESRAAEGFIKIWGLPVETLARTQSRSTSPAQTTEAV